MPTRALLCSALGLALLAPGAPVRAADPEPAPAAPSTTTATANVPVMLADVWPGPGSSVPFKRWEVDRLFWAAGGRVWFAAYDGAHGLEPWVTDGTQAGTAFVGDVEPGKVGSNPSGFTAAGGVVAFQTAGEEVGGAIRAVTGTGVTLLAEGEDVRPIDAVAFGDVALFTTSNFQDNAQLWRSDGTVAGTVPLKQRLVLPDSLTPIGDVVVFLDGQNPLRRTDGTPAGTDKVRSWGDHVGGSTILHDLTAVGRRAFFVVEADVRAGREVWVTDGTRARTRLVHDLRPGFDSSEPRELTAYGRRLLFVADDGRHGRQIWRTDGTAGGTRRLTGVEGMVGEPTPCGGAIWFTARDDDGRGLWVRTASGRVRRVAGAGSVPQEVTCAAGTLAFSAKDDEHGRELWTVTGPRERPVLHDLSLTGSSRPGLLEAVGTSVYFVADDGAHGREPWVLPTAA